MTTLPDRLVIALALLVIAGASVAALVAGAVPAWQTSAQRFQVFQTRTLLEDCPRGTKTCKASDASSAACCSADQVCSNGGCCAAGQSYCKASQQCVDLASDTVNCGRCGITCPSGWQCISGACQLVCSSVVVDPTTDSSNCGACGNTCGSGQECKQGRCQCHDASQAFCGSQCVPIKQDNNNCGACGVVCPPGSTCNGGHCMCANGGPINSTANCGGCGLNCPAGQVCSTAGQCCLPCGKGTCVNPLTDVSNCGGCGAACPAASSLPNVASVTCSAGKCAIATCAPGYADCNRVLSDGCEVNTNADPLNCGSCGAVASLPNVAVATCSAGVPGVGQCSRGFADCNGQASDGCETNIFADAHNCGGCGVSAVLANAAAQCAAGQPTIISCNPGYADCNHQVTDGCEINTTSDPVNCGSCGTVATLANTATAGCSNSSPTVVACSTGWADCNGVPSDGCEVDITTSTANCGACNHPAAPLPNAVPKCSGGSAVRGTCNAGWGDCNNDPSDGCETDLTTSSSNCGACGVVATLPNTVAKCVAGHFAVASCAAGFADCNGRPEDGCEVNLMTDAANCGSCGHVATLANATAGCAAGQPVISSCNAGFADCNNSPADGCEVDTRSDDHNCGACGREAQLANAVATCINGAPSEVACNANYGDCNSDPADGCEVDLRTSTTSCGSCGVHAVLPNAQATCTDGVISLVSCNAGWGNCDNDPSNGCETDLTSSANNCGACGVVARVDNAVAACVASNVVISSCNSGYVDCNGVTDDGCETHLLTSNSSCGTCGVPAQLPNAEAYCSAGRPAISSCNPGWGDCNNNPSDGCETDLTTSASNCGACGVVATLPNAVAQCVAGHFAVASCAAGSADCNGRPEDGCEVDLLTDFSNCGECRQAAALANAVTNCTAGQPAIVSCNAGFGDCNHDPSDGCEADLMNSAANCGGCGVVASLPNSVAKCVAGQFAVASCSNGYGDCNGQASDGCETNIHGNDNANCGACNRTAELPGATATCLAGEPQLVACNAGFGNCDNDPSNGCEANFATDADNCGACGQAALFTNGIGQCRAGQPFLASCRPGFADCNGNSADGCEVNTNTDAQNCGGCGVSAPNAASVTCNLGALVINSCNTGYSDCNNVTTDGCEVNLLTDAQNCGSCGTSVTSLPNAVATCSNGHVVLSACLPGFLDCNNDPSDGCEVNLNTDVANCGQCNRPAVAFANAAPKCFAGTSVLGTCNPGWANCDGNPANGCEVDITSSLNNCGSCGAVVSASFPNGAATCVNGTAVVSCASGYADCNRNLADGCEVNLMTDVKNCGSCGRTLNITVGRVQTASCTNGQLGIIQCASTFRDCNSNPADGCEINTSNDPNNCGGCGVVATAYPNAAPACLRSAPTVGTCLPGWGNCDGNTANGCESNILNNGTYCGGCGSSFLTNSLFTKLYHATARCQNGVRVVDYCDDGFANCNGVDADGCEIWLVNNTNCGACGTVCPSGLTCSQKQADKSYSCRAPYAYSTRFFQGVAPTSTQCSNWVNFWFTFQQSYWTKVTFNGTYDPVGVSTGDADTLIGFFNSAASFNYDVTAAHGGFVSGTPQILAFIWARPGCASGPPLPGDTTPSSPYVWWQAPPNYPSGQCIGTTPNCNIGYAIRPCQGATTWGGINTTLCNAPTQDISFILGG